MLSKESKRTALTGLRNSSIKNTSCDVDPPSLGSYGATRYKRIAKSIGNPFVACTP